jgi:hypothetical protein
MKETRKIGQEIKKLQQQRAEIQASGLKAAKEALAEAKAKAVEAEAGRVRREQRERVIHAPQRESAPVIQCSNSSLPCLFSFYVFRSPLPPQAPLPHRPGRPS